MNKKYITTSRGKVYYWIKKNNNDKCIIFTHGVTADHTLFDKQIEFWSKEYTVITWDMPLHGESRPYFNFTFNNLADDLKAIMDVENIKNAVMVGQSAGGYVVQSFIQKYPSAVDAFIAVDTTPYGKQYYKKGELFFTKHFSTFAKLYPYKYYCKVSAKSSTFTKESYDSFYKCLIKLGKKNMLECSDAVYKDFTNYDEVLIKCPVLLIIGENDEIGYVKKYNDMWHERRGYPIKIISRASHNSNFDNYEEFNTVVYKFLKDKKSH